MHVMRKSIHSESQGGSTKHAHNT